MASRFRAFPVPAWSLVLAGLLILLTAAAPRLSAQETKPGVDEPHQVGKDITAPVKISGAAPVYTELARRARVVGTVVVEAIIDQHGDVTNARVLRGLPMGLDRAAVNAVQTWKFKPALLNGKPVKVYYVLTVNFSLEPGLLLGPELLRFLNGNPEFAADLPARRYAEAAAYLDRRAAEQPAVAGLDLARCYLLLKEGKLEEAWGKARSAVGPESYERLYLVGAFARDRVVADKLLSPQGRATVVHLGLQAEDLALAARGEGCEALYYKGWLLEEKAKLVSDPAEREALEREATQLLVRSEQLKPKPPAPAGSGHPG
jgi:TonB family protein